ncbi:hypothetical protein [Veillonella rogosae]|uniref:hypothetical protein n=1 Tax=Veillonella rogosae TaxID=423477 RepID=UPI003990D5CE
MNSTKVVETVDTIRRIIKLVFGLLLKLILLLIWGLSLWGFCNLLYDRYVLEAYPLRDYLPVLPLGIFGFYQGLSCGMKSYIPHLISPKFIIELRLGAFL